MATKDNFLLPIVDPQHPNLDIVVVHGLNPFNKVDHASSTWTLNGKLWLKDFLPRRLPDARVLLFGYNSNVAFETSIDGLEGQARNLLNKLDFARRDDPNRPIIFCGPQSRRHPSEERGNHASLGDIATRFALAGLLKPRNNLMEYLKKDSLVSEMLTDAFKHQYEDYHILSCFETRFFKNMPDVIVDEKSAVLGLPGKRETVIGLDGDHSKICKFEQTNDEYLQVENNIVDLAEFSLKKAAERSQRILQQDDHQLKAVEPAFFVPYTENPGFVGRRQLFERLTARFSQDGPSSRMALFGLGGVGKTQLAIKYAYWLRANQPDTSIFWIHASNSERFHHSFLELAQKLHIPDADSPKVDILALVKDWLLQQSSGKWVLIIDNADDFDMFFSRTKSNDTICASRMADYIPDCSHGSVLVTTRDKKVALRILRNEDPLSLFKVLPLEEAEAAELVRKVLAGEKYGEEDVRDLTESLEHLPLAITQAAAFILENDIGIRTYLQLFNENKENAMELLSHNFEAIGRDEETDNAVATAWMLSFKKIKEQNPHAADLLALMAFLDRHCIPKELLRRYDESISVMEFEKACGILKAFSLIDENPMTIAGVQHRALSMHRMVQLVTRQWLKYHKGSTHWADNALAAVSKVFPPGERENWDRCEVYLPHVQVVLDSDEGSSTGTQFKADLLHNASSYFRVKGYHGRAEKMGVEAVEMRRTLLGENHPDTILSLTSLSRVYLEQGRLSDAIEVQKSAVTATKAVLGGDCTDSIDNMNQVSASLQATRHLAAIYGIEGRYDEAEKLELEVLDQSKKILGKEHPDTMLVMRDLAVTYSHQGRPNEAEVLHQRVFEVRKRILGEDHPETLISMSDLVTTYYQQDAVKNAVKAQQMGAYIVEASKKILGVEHPNTLQAMRDLAVMYELQNRGDDASDIIKHVNEESKRGHNTQPATFRAMSDQIITYRQQSLEEVVHKLQIEKASKIVSKSTITVRVKDTSASDQEASGGSLLLQPPAPDIERREQRQQKDEGKTRKPWHWRLLSRDRQHGKD